MKLANSARLTIRACEPIRSALRPLPKAIMKKTLAVFLGYVLISSDTLAQPVSRPAPSEAKMTQFKCNSNPCANTATGEDPSEIAEKKGARISNELEQTANDRDRWSATTLYSDSKKPGGPALDIIKSVQFRIKLQPKTGTVLFEKGGIVHAFSIASPLGKPDRLCPAYAVSVVDAGFDYAVIQVNCFLYQFAPKRFYGSEEFFLYDMQTASMRSIWDAGISDNSVQGRLVSPNPTVKKISNGYTLIWNVKDRSKSATETYKVRASYIRSTEKNGTHAVLTCTDLTAPKGENIEVGICEGRHPKLVTQ